LTEINLKKMKRQGSGAGFCPSDRSTVFAVDDTLAFWMCISNLRVGLGEEKGWGIKNPLSYRPRGCRGICVFICFSKYGIRAQRLENLTNSKKLFANYLEKE
jgi:hypothetical protein